MRPTLRLFVFAPALVIAAACSKDKPADPSLNADLNLAGQSQGARLDSISAAERMNGGVTPAGTPANGLRTGAAPAPAASAPSPVRHTTASAPARRRSTSSGSGTSVSTHTTVSTGHEEIHKNTNRDAAIGAAAGAVIGGTTGGLKGGIIGAAAGGILGGVIGNNVDVQKKRVP